MREPEGSKESGAGEVPDITGKDKESKGVRKPSAKEIRTPQNLAGKTHEDASSPDSINVIQQIKEKHSRTDPVELGIYRTLPDGRYISINPTFARIFGFNSPEEFLASFADVGSSYISRDRFEELKNLVLEEGACTMEVQVHTKDGGTKWLSNEMRAVRDEGGAIIYFEGFVQDITARKRAMEKFHKTFQISPTMMSINSFRDARFIHANRSYLIGTGYESEELIGRTISELSIMSSDELALFSSRLKEHGRLHNVEGHFRKKSGEIRDALFSVEIVAIDDETCLLVSAQDITERKKAEADLRRQTALLSGINDVLRKTFTSEKGVEIAEKCLAVARALTRSAFAFLCEQADDMLLEVMASSGYGEPSFGADKVQLICNLNSDILRKGLKGEGEPLIFNSPALCATRFLVPQGYPPITRFLGVPVAVDNQVIGLICLANKESGYTAEDAADVKALSVSLVEGLYRIRVEESLRRSEIKYRTLLESIQDGVVIVDRDGKFIYVNEVITARSGFTEEQFLGQYMFNVFKPEHRGFLRERFAALLRGEPPVSFEVSYLNAARKDEWVEICYSPIHDGEMVSGAIATSRNITWRKAAEEELRVHREHLEKLVEERTKALEESEWKYRHLVDNARAGVYQSTLAGERIYVNDNFLRILGYESQDEVKSVPPSSHYKNPKDRERLVKILIEKGQADNYEVELVTKQGRSVNILLSAIATGDIVSGIAFDITERKRAEEAIRVSEEKYRSLFDLESDAIFLIDIETGLIIDANRAALSAFGYTMKEMLGKTNVDLSAEPEKTREAIRLKLSSVPLRYFRRKDGSTFPAEVVATYLTLLGRPAYLISARDITERRKTEEALLESEKKYRDLVENSLVGVYITTISGTILYVNEPLLRILGFNSISELGQSGSAGRYKRPGDRAKLMEILLRDGKVNGYEVELLSKTGETVNALLSVTRKGDLLSGMMIDITPRKKAEDALKTSEHNLRLILDSVHDAIFIHDVTGKITDVNAKMLEMYGVTREEAMLFSIEGDYSSPENDLDSLALYWQAVLKGETRLFEWKARKPHDGAAFDAEVFLTGIRIDGNKHILAMVRDITERKVAEQLLLQSEKKYRDLVENALVAVFQAQWDNHGHGGITYVNSTFLSLLGYESLEEVRAAGTKKIFKDPAVHSNLAQALLWGGSVEDQEVQLVTKSGEVVYWALAVTHSGTTMSGMARDVTARKKAEALIRQHLVFIEQLLDCVPLPVYYKKTDGTFVGCNKAYSDFVVLPKEFITGYTAWELFPPDIAERFSRADAELLETKGIQTFEIKFPHADGTLRDVIYTKATYDDANGNVAGIVGVIQDITKRKRAEDALRASETRYKTLFDHSNNSVFLLKGDVIVDCNEMTLSMFKGQKEDIVGRFPYQLSPEVQPDGRDSKDAAIRVIQAALSGEPQFFEWKLQRLTGEMFDSEVTLNRIDLGDEALVQVQVADVSHRREAEIMTRLSEEKYRNLVENALVAMLQTDMDGRIFYVNEAFLHMFAYDAPRDIKKMNVQKLIARRQDWRTILKRCADEGHVSNIELEAFTGAGDTLTTMGAITCDGSTMTWMLVDITGRRRMEEDLKAKSDDLHESNTALKVLLDQRDKDKREIEEKILSNVKDLVFPYLENLTGTALSPRQDTLVSTIRSNLNEIISPFLKNIRYQYSHFTPTEIKVAGFIKDGKTVKEIANILGCSESAVNLHRQHIRKKLSLTNEKINLRTYLQSLGE